MSLIGRLFGMNGATPAPPVPTKRPVGRPRTPENVARNAEIVEKYKSGLSTVTLAAEYGVSRERICQLLRKDNVIATKQQRDRLARETLKRDAQHVKDQAREDRARKISRALELVREGKAQREAGATVGLTSNEQNLLSLACREAGLEQRYGRWRDFSARNSRVRELHAQGMTLGKVISTLRAEGDNVCRDWIIRRCADLRWPRGGLSRVKTRRQKPPKADPVWTGEKVAELRRHWLNGCSAQQISDIFGPPFTRSAVIGKANRLRHEKQLYREE